LDDGASKGLLFGVGTAYAMLMAPPIFKAFAPPKTRAIVIVCLNCSAKNPEKNKYCGNCGRPLYPNLK